MSHDLQKSRVRNNLKPRREPYWAAPIAKGRFVGLRKNTDGPDTWIARIRDEDGRQRYKSLGIVTDAFDLDAAKVEALRWFNNQEAGVTDDVVTVADACKEYVKDRRREKGESTAHDAELRFERVVYNTAFGRRPLTKLRTTHIKEFRAALGKPSAANRTWKSVRAALNLAVANRQAPATLIQEWRGLGLLKAPDNRRSLYLDLDQRRVLLEASTGAIRDLLEAAILTGARPGELVHATRMQFEARTAVMTFSGKIGTRTVPISPVATALFKRLSKSKLPNAPLFAREDGTLWTSTTWCAAVREAVQKAKLPKETCLYTLRHSWISAAIEGGLNPLEVARLVGTSLVQIERHYGHLSNKGARERLAQVKMI